MKKIISNTTKTSSKQIKINLLKKKLEEATGKKITLKEFATDPDPSIQQAIDSLKSSLEIIRKAHAASQTDLAKDSLYILSTKTKQAILDLYRELQ